MDCSAFSSQLQAYCAQVVEFQDAVVSLSDWSKGMLSWVLWPLTMSLCSARLMIALRRYT